MLRFAIVPLVSAALAGAPAQAVVIIGQLFNTGAGLPATQGTVDSNYVITGGDHPGITIGAQAVRYYNNAYAAENTGSRWISFASNGGSGVGTFDVTTSFDLTGYLPGTASITGTWGVDNNGIMLLNGVNTGVSRGGFNSLAGFSINSGFVSGINTLTLRVRNSGGPAAVRLDQLVLSADIVPEPGSWAMLIAGFGLVGAARRRSRAAHKLA
ncbi:MAG: PEPxxWA-CTERM sorting domain-containing protein [Polymorphobacter sp.]|uniref:PEPxxWA-CTERM sorting domain-containing protein n=1 Tax=Polymorphobacter sp. TaxID=1909290 RepID=UPI003A8992AE